MGECKWRNRPVGSNVLTDLRRAAMPLLTQLPGVEVYYALFAKAGFTPDLMAQATQDRTLLLYDIETIGRG
jgi:hypothetical protein